MKILSALSRKKLLTQHRTERDGRIKDRIKVLLWHDEGKTIEEISKLLYLSPQTIKNHITEYEENQNLKPSNGGSKSKLSEKQNKELSEHLESYTYTKVKDISNYISKTYRIKYSNSGLTKWLQENGFRYKKPKGIPGKIDFEAQKAFICKYREMERNLKKDEEIIFLDSCHPSQSTKLSYGWIKKGKDKQIETTASRTRLNITGAINIKNREIIIEKYDTINSINLIDFLKKILKNYPNRKKLNIIADGAGYHKSKEIQKFIKNKKIKIHILPPYSPNLNPIERLWKIMNEYVRDNKYYKTAKEFRSAIDEFFSGTIPRITKELYTRINSNFQIIKN